MPVFLGFPGGSDGTESACNAGDLSLIPGSGRSPEEGNGKPLQYSCLENSMDRGALRATVHGGRESDMTEQLSLSRIEDERKESRKLNRSYHKRSTLRLCIVTLLV